MIANVFDILCNRWQIFHKPIQGSAENVERYTLACLALHNYLRPIGNTMYTPDGFAALECSDGSKQEGEKRSHSNAGCFESTNPVCGSHYFKDTLTIRDALKCFVNSENRSLP